MACSLIAFTASLFPVISSVSQEISGVLKSSATMALGCLLVFRLNRSLRLSSKRSMLSMGALGGR